mgnify:CR=1 FL=1
MSHGCWQIGHRSGGQESRWRAVQGLTQTLDRRADVRLAKQVSTLEQGLRAPAREQRSDGTHRHDQPDAAPDRARLKLLLTHALRLIMSVFSCLARFVASNLRASCLLAAVFAGSNTAAQEDSAAFSLNLRLADTAKGRVDRVKYLKEALRSRPDHPENIVLEYRIGTAIAYQDDPSDRKPPDRSEAVEWLTSVANNYTHSDFYENRDSAGTWDPQFMVPRAKIQLASTTLAETDTRQLMLSAMQDIDYTIQRRVVNWGSAPEPVKSAMTNAKKLPSQRAEWRKQIEAARSGEVLGVRELQVADSVVRNFAYSFGPQRYWEVGPTMQIIIDRFPGTPLERIAQMYADDATKLTRNSAEHLFDESVKSMTSLLQLLDAEPTREDGGDQIVIESDNVVRSPDIELTGGTLLSLTNILIIAGVVLGVLLVAVAWIVKRRLNLPS